jgi:hypothetical protein
VADITATQALDENIDRRRDPRSELILHGRYMCADRNEYECQTIDVSASGIALLGLAKTEVGQHVIAYLTGLGRIEGNVVRQFNRAFAIELLGPSLKRERLATRIKWLVAHRSDAAVERRAKDRELENWSTSVVTEGAEQYPATITDFVATGATILVKASPAIGSLVAVGRTHARVIRHLPDGIVVSFDGELNPTRKGAC